MVLPDGGKHPQPDLDAPRVRDFLTLLRQGPTVIDPTLAAFEGNSVQRQGETNPCYASIAEHLPAAHRRRLRTNSMNVTDANVERYRKYLSNSDLNRGDRI
jgi:hypothetical protein